MTSSFVLARRALLGTALLAAVLALPACQSSAPVAAPVVAPAALPQAPLVLRPLGGVVVPRDAAQPLLKHFGGISGLDYDPAQDLWFLLSDDRSNLAPARFYTARIDLDAQGLRGVRVTGMTALLQRNGQPYPGEAQAGTNAGLGAEIPDPEALRLDPVDGQLVWSSEGDRPRGLHPFVRRATREGAYLGEVPLPERLRMHPDAPRGVRHNAAIEGLAFTPDRLLWVALEGPLFEDGESPTPDHGALVRLTRMDRQGRVLGQYAYPLDAVPVPPSGGGRNSDNGLTEILATEAGTLLVLERSGREVGGGQYRFSVRLYEASAAGATDVQAIDALAGAAGQRITPMRKRLVLDLSQAGLGHIDNLEGAAWGPRRPNGRPTLVLVSDDNFQSSQVTQFLAFEVAR